MWVTSAEMFNSRDIEPEETISNSQTGFLVEGWGYQITYYTFDSKLLLKEIHGQKNGSETEEVHPRGRH